MAPSFKSTKGNFGNKEQVLIQHLIVTLTYIVGYNFLTNLTHNVLQVKNNYGLEVKIFFPAHGLTIAILLYFGIRFAYLIFLNPLYNALLLNAPLYIQLSYPCLILFAYGGSCLILINIIKINTNLQRLKDVLQFILIFSFAPFFLALPYISLFVHEGIIDTSEFWTVVLDFWIGDLLGILTLTPILITDIFPKFERMMSQLTKFHSSNFIIFTRNTYFNLFEIFTYVLIPIIICSILSINPNLIDLEFLFFIPLVYFSLVGDLSGGIRSSTITIYSIVSFSSFLDIPLHIPSFYLLFVTLSVIGLIIGVVLFEKKEREIQLGKKNMEIQTLLREIQHRVRNNLQIVSSIVNLQNPRLSINEILSNFQNRIKSMVLIHDVMYYQADFTKANLSTYIHKLSNHLFDFHDKFPKINLIISLTDNSIPIDQAIPLSMILNELLTNSIQHGLDSNQKINIEIIEMDTQYRLHYSDKDSLLNSGIPLDLSNYLDDTGLRIIDALVGQLEGSLFIDNSSFFTEIIFHL